MGHPKPINLGTNSHDGKELYMYAKGTRNSRKWIKPKGRKSGRSYSEENPNGKRRLK